MSIQWLYPIYDISSVRTLVVFDHVVRMFPSLRFLASAAVFNSQGGACQQNYFHRFYIARYEDGVTPDKSLGVQPDQFVIDLGLPLENDFKRIQGMNDVKTYLEATCDPKKVEDPCNLIEGFRYVVVLLIFTNKVGISMTWWHVSVVCLLSWWR